MSITCINTKPEQLSYLSRHRIKILPCNTYLTV